ncbi:MAG: biosynthetic-type acetolactate synthase large subunit [Fibromonadaceae bacterium]|jgi:acetolactate synthase-1/2/3 large subunit|nr:biosynthetic-type acetolactate synthase large subunit [Fibromonadaceae bacterium]
MAIKSLNGAQVMIECLKREGVDTVFGYPGGNVIPIFDAILDSDIKLVLTRHEQGATHAADGYARVTGKTGVVLVTSGPGATNTLTGIYTAYMDSIPLVVFTGQTISPNLGTDAFQESDISGMSFATVKHSYLVKNTNDLPRVIKEAFYVAHSGRRGPVLIDLPKDVSSAPCTAPFVDSVDLPGYKVPNKAEQSEVEQAAITIKKSKKPLILVGHGAAMSGASRAVKELAEKLGSPVSSTLLGLGTFPASHELSLGMTGMHGTVPANKAIYECDLLISIGSRFDDRITAKLSEFVKQCEVVHIDIDPAEYGKIIIPKHFLCGDAKMVLEQLLPMVDKLDSAEWLKTIASWKRKYPLTYPKQGGLRVQHVVQTLHEVTQGKAIVVADVGQHQMWTAQFFKCDYPGQLLNSGGAGTMGFGFPAAIGAAIGNKTGFPVCAVLGDGGFQMTLCELATAKINKLPMKIFIMDNHFLGMVRQWQDMFYDKRYSGVLMEENPDFVKLAKAYGIEALYISRNVDARRIIEKAMEINDGPVLIHCECEQEDNVFPMIPPGASIKDILIERPKEVLEKPTGGT